MDLIIETEEVDIIQDYSYDVSYGLENDDEEYDDTLSEEFENHIFDDSSSEEERRSIDRLFHDIQSEEDWSRL